MKQIQFIVPELLVQWLASSPSVQVTQVHYLGPAHFAVCVCDVLCNVWTSKVACSHPVQVQDARWQLRHKLKGDVSQRAGAVVNKNSFFSLSLYVYPLYQDLNVVSSKVDKLQKYHKLLTCSDYGNIRVIQLVMFYSALL